MRVLYSKFNRERLPDFQLQTNIIENDDGKIYVKKKPLTKEARNHIKRLFENYNLLKSNFKDLSFCHCKLINDEIVMEYIDGKSLEAKLVNLIKGNKKSEFLSEVDKYRKYLEKMKNCSFNQNDEDIFFEDVFSIKNIWHHEKCIDIANIDLTFDNIVEKNQEWFVVDYEWVFKFTVPLDFIFFRSLYFLFLKYSYFIDKKVFEFDKIMDSYGINEKDRDLFLNMEDSFQNYVLGKERRFCISDNYNKKVYSYEEMRRNVGIISELQKQIGQTGKQLEEMHNILNQKENELSELKIETECYKNLLKEKENELLRIQSSKGYRLLIFIHKIKNRLLSYIPLK